MEKLELKHIKPYKDLQFNSGHFLVGIFEGNDNDITRPLLLSETKGGCIDWEAGLDMVMPYLKPLSDLNGDCEMDEHIIDKGTSAEICWDEWEFLFENHYDVFGLIEKGLAININTI